VLKSICKVPLDDGDYEFYMKVPAQVKQDGQHGEPGKIKLNDTVKLQRPKYWFRLLVDKFEKSLAKIFAPCELIEAIAAMAPRNMGKGLPAVLVGLRHLREKYSHVELPTDQAMRTLVEAVLFTDEQVRADLFTSSSEFWSLVVRGGAGTIFEQHLKGRPTMRNLGRLCLLIHRDEASLERLFSHMQQIVGPYGGSITCLSLQRRLKLKVMKGDWTSVDLSFAFTILRRAMRKKSAYVRQKTRKDKGLPRKTRVHVLMDESDEKRLMELFVEDEEEVAGADAGDGEQGV